MEYMTSLHDSIIDFDGEARSGEKPSDFIVKERIKDQITINRVSLSDFLGFRARIPEYQRGYQWEESQLDDLWDELSEFIKRGENLDRTSNRTGDVFFGSMFFSERKASNVLDTGEEGTVYDIIDGQQRLTTLSVLLKIISEVLKDNLEDCGGKFIGRYAQHVGSTNNLIYRGDDSRSGPAITLEPRNRDFYRALMRDDSALCTFLLYQKQVPSQSRGAGQIKISEFLEIFDIDEATYLRYLFDDSYFTNVDSDEYLSRIVDESKYIGLQGRRPNVQLYKKDQKILAEYSSPAELTDEDRDELLSNRVEFDGTNQRLLNCYKYFNERISSELEGKDSEEKYRFATNLKKYIINCFQVGHFEIKDNRPELLMKIFEVLNDRGLELKKTDLIRTKLVGKLNELPEDEKEKYLSMWNDIISRFNSNHKHIIKFLETFFVVNQTRDGTSRKVTSRGEISSHLLEAFSEDDDESDRTLRGRLNDPQETKSLICSLKRYSVCYNQITDPTKTGGFDFNQENDAVSACNRCLSRLNQTGTDIWEPLVLAFYHDIRESNNDKIDRLRSLLDVVESFVIRYYVSGDINAKDQIYAAGIDQYHDSGISSAVEETMIDKAWEIDSSIFGGELVSSLADTEWGSNRAKPVLQMLVSQDLAEDESSLLSIELNRDNQTVELEHVFPRSPMEDGNLEWIEQFFQLNDVQAPDAITEETTFIETIRGLVEEEREERLEEIASTFSAYLGNSILIISSNNQSISNAEFPVKLLGYYNTKHFDCLVTNKYISDRFFDNEYFDNMDMDEYELTKPEDYNEFIEEYFELPQEYYEAYRGEWTYESVFENMKQLIQKIMDHIEFDVDDVIYEPPSEDEIKTEVRNQQDAITDIIRANNRRYL